MARKIFVSYKYGDTSVKPLTDGFFDSTKARDYVTELQQILSDNDEIYKGENDGEDLSDFKDSTIESKLRDKIFDSSITIVVVSKGMKSFWDEEKDQWIPWEVSYSLRELSKGGRKSRPNGVLMVALPDEDGSYDYYIKEKTCPHCNCRTLMTNFLFGILKRNVFNNKNIEESDCDKHSSNPVYTGDHSYIKSVKWEDFVSNPTYYLDECARLRDKIEDFNISKVIHND
ncbi:TIR domain-containing protein [Pseudoalteromonas piscicida]|uniref:TIR domain-containing protein n=1 Tax=Pseudoalteromonas piscicida TaxID=43662 RepID=UPI001C94FD62|nr:TIR domain-containing protein [Pseudoalteromonas piscicida]QZO12575.1 TIR domain-containing protein [Pseudoalteromonas piscicida]